MEDGDIAVCANSCARQDKITLNRRTVIPSMERNTLLSISSRKWKIAHCLGESHDETKAGLTRIASAHFALPESVSRRCAVAVRNAQRRNRHTGLGGDMGSYLLIRNIALVGQANMQAPSPMQS